MGGPYIEAPRVAFMYCCGGVCLWKMLVQAIMSLTPVPGLTPSHTSPSHFLAPLPLLPRFQCGRSHEDHVSGEAAERDAHAAEPDRRADGV